MGLLLLLPGYQAVVRLIAFLYASKAWRFCAGVRRCQSFHIMGGLLSAIPLL